MMCAAASRGRNSTTGYAMPGESRFIDVRGTRLHYLHWDGDGTPVLILHGNTHAGGVYEPLGDRLASGHEVLALDLRGHGLSDKPDNDYAWSVFRDDVAGLLDQLDLRDAVFVAHSRGGGVTLLGAAARPDRVRGVVTYEPTLPASISGALAPTETPEARMQRLVARAENRRSTVPDREAVYNHFRGRGAFVNWRDEYLRAFVRHCVIETEGGGVELASPTRIEAQLYTAMLDIDAWAERQQTPSDLRVHVIYGEKGDRLGPGRDPFGALQRLFPNSTMEIMPEASHSGPQEYPEAFEKIIRDFIAGL
jgi:pimeloyl-ACP methyl ester carboxylesterase